MSPNDGPPVNGRLGYRIIDWWLWSWRIAELRLLPRGPARRAAFREAHRELTSMRGGHSWLFILLPLCLLAVFAPNVLCGSRLLSAAVVIVFAASVVFDAPKLRELRTGVRRQLVLAGIPICIHCGYDLRGIEAPACPECGEVRGEADVPAPHAS